MRLITRWRHHRRLHLFRRVYSSLAWVRSYDPVLTRQNVQGRHNAYRAALEVRHG